MISKANSTWYLCTIGKGRSANWQICKDYGLWGVASVPGKTRRVSARKGDMLLFYMAGEGLIGYGEITAEPYAPSSKDDLPWPGGKYRFKTVIPFKLSFESMSPVQVKFESMKFPGTDVHTSRLQKGFSLISNKDALRIIELMKHDE